MYGLQETIEKITNNLFTTKHLVELIIGNEFKNIGVPLTEHQINLFVSRLENGEGPISIEFDDDLIADAGFPTEQAFETVVSNIFRELPIKLENVFCHLGETIQSSIDSAAEEMSDEISLMFISDCEDEKTTFHELQFTAEPDVKTIWGKALSQFGVFVSISEEVASDYVLSRETSNNLPYKFGLVTSLHDRAILIAKEIFTLLRNGYSEGANARWRTLHELSVTAAFLTESDDRVSEQFIDHDAVQRYRAATTYNEYCDQLHTNPIPSTELEDIKQSYDSVLKKYGPSFKYEYGWAAQTLQIKRPTFRSIEAKVELDHHRPYYKFSSENIHANIRGLPCFYDSSCGDKISGPNPLGIAQPIQSSIISLNNITASLLSQTPSVDMIVILKSMAKYGREIERMFLGIQKNISVEYTDS